MRILAIWDADYPWDIRVEKIANALMEAGHTVHLVARNRARKARYEAYKGLHIHRIAALPRVLGGLNGPFTFPAFFSPVWLWEIFRQARKHRCDLILARDLPIAPAGLLVGKLLGIPTVLDMAECYPEMLKSIWRFDRFKIQNILVRNPYLAYPVEHLVCRFVNHILVMVEESRDRLIGKGVDPRKITIVSNTPIAARFAEAQPSAPSPPSPGNGRAYTLTYLGILGHSRGIDGIIEGTAEYVRENPGFRFHVIGGGKAERKLKDLTARLGLTEHVRFEGFVDNARIPGLIATSDVCVVPHRRSGHWDNTIPNKLFDYMAAAKPVLATDTPPVARVVRETDCGRIYRDRDTADLVARLRELEHPDLRRALGRRGREAVIETFNWESDKRALLAVVDNLAEAGGRE